jgi:HD-GYP domain-containing protein (c-di-GMP phosphodiesterase class II)
MDLVEKQFAIDHLQMGMYVHRLDRDWLETPFPIQGFFVSSPDDIEVLRRYCQHVFVDIERKWSAHDERLARARHTQTAVTGIEAQRGRVRYTDSVSLNAEVQRARSANQNATRISSQIIEDVRAGRKLSAEHVNDAVGPIVESVLRNADAFFWVSSLLRRDAYLYSHAVNCAAMGAALGRHMGFPPELLSSLATGGLLFDVGKAELPDSVLNAPDQLSNDVRWAMRKHVLGSLRIMEEAGIDDVNAHDMVRWHHERWDGSGYPDGLKGQEIPLFARMAAVIDSFDAMTSERAYQSPTSRHAALQELYRGHDTLYQRDVVEQFLQCMSIYPTGSLVELNTGQVGIVIAQNHARRLRPRVMLLLDANKEPYTRYPVIDLLAHNEVNPERPVDVAAIPEPGAYGLDPTALYLG